MMQTMFPLGRTETTIPPGRRRTEKSLRQVRAPRVRQVRRNEKVLEKENPRLRNRWELLLLYLVSYLKFSVNIPSSFKIEILFFYILILYAKLPFPFLYFPLFHIFLFISSPFSNLSLISLEIKQFPFSGFPLFSIPSSPHSSSFTLSLLKSDKA